MKNGHVVEKVMLGDIYFIEGMKDYVRIWKKEEKIMTLLTFNRLLDILPEDNFCRIHKSYIIALDKIDMIERNIVHILNEGLTVGKKFQKEFFRRIELRRIN